MLILAFEPSLWWVGLLLGLGIFFALAEIFIPSHGILTVLSVLSFLGAIVLGFLVGASAGLLTLLAVVLLTPLLLYAAMRLWPHTPMARHLILTAPESFGKAGDLAHLRPEELKGRTGVAKTLLRPAGKMTLGDRHIDCVTEGEYVQPGTRVRIIDVQGARVVVRPVAEQPEEA